jgi:CheY-like chemotaxis protein
MTLRVLVVDDVEDTRESLAILARLWGHEVLVAADFKAALEAANQFSPHVVLLDIAMPGNNGWELGRVLREQYGNALFLVAITGFAREADRTRSGEAGLDAHLDKPADPVVVEALLAERASLLRSSPALSC